MIERSFYLKQINYEKQKVFCRKTRYVGKNKNKQMKGNGWKKYITLSKRYLWWKAYRIMLKKLKKYVKTRQKIIQNVENISF